MSTDGREGALEGDRGAFRHADGDAAPFRLSMVTAAASEAPPTESRSKSNGADAPAASSVSPTITPPELDASTNPR